MSIDASADVGGHTYHGGSKVGVRSCRGKGVTRGDMAEGAELQEGRDRCEELLVDVHEVAPLQVEDDGRVDVRRFHRSEYEFRRGSQTTK